MERPLQTCAVDDLLALAEPAVRHVATLLHEYLRCRRRACRRNGCCGPVVAGAPLDLSDGRRVALSDVPPCLHDADAQTLALFRHYLPQMLAVRLADPACKLHPARLYETPGKAWPSGPEGQGTEAGAPPAVEP
ncbi:hypothetical protein LXM94_20230 [Rhizobium sp. TRM95111]|uniref:hypothetical protein n=1 Tax=Rhizobium alarense TaxID=2846851 RepID=UPI001F481473|nr:hypothetical protein [Rhizobium alarense]MCF3642302.1 hypothetical protein [Rhizobium alarense]